MPKTEKEKIIKKVVKAKSAPIEPVKVTAPVEPEPKKKATRAKKPPPTKEEVLKLLNDGAVEL